MDKFFRILYKSRFIIVFIIVCYPAIILALFFPKSSENIYEKSLKSVVTITVNENKLKSSIGSGVIFREILNEDKLYLYQIITANHVIDSRNDDMSIKIYIPMYSNPVLCKVLYTNNIADIAIFSIVSSIKLNFSKVNTKVPNIGDQIFQIGSPYGYKNTINWGYVSNTHRYVDKSIISYIQTDCDANPGNSGGGVFNSKGDLIGIVDAILVGPKGVNQSTGICLVIPIDLIINILKIKGIY